MRKVGQRGESGRQTVSDGSASTPGLLEAVFGHRRSEQIRIIEELRGRVVAVGDDQFTLRFRIGNEPAKLRDEAFPVIEITPEDRHLLREGAQLVWITFHEDQSRYRSRGSVLVFANSVRGLLDNARRFALDELARRVQAAGLY